MTAAVDSPLWVRCFRPSPGANVRLVCFPHAGGSAGFYSPLTRALHPQVSVLAVQYPGRQDRRGEPPMQDIGELAGAVAEALAPWARQGPMAFFGHSMGAVVAFETARELERTGTGPVMLFASGRRAPGIVRDERVHQGDDASILAELRRLNGTESALLQDDELVRLTLPAIRSDYQAVETYVCPPGARVHCPVVALVGDSDPRVDVDEARHWADHTGAEFTLHTFPGGHFYLQAQVTQLRDRIAADLEAWTTTGAAAADVPAT